MKDSYKRTEIGEIPEDWKIETIGNLSLIATGGRNTQDRIASGGFPFFVRSQTVERIDSYSYDGEAVLTAGDGVGTGKVFHYINGKFDYHQRVYRISDFKPSLNGYFFFLYFSANFYERIMSMTAKSSVDSVRMEMIADMLIPLPSPKEQRAIAEVLRNVEDLIAGLERLIAKKRALKTAVMQQLLTGRTRLPGFGAGQGYKRTEVGLIPADWEVAPLGTVLKIRHGKSQKSIEVPDGAYPILATGGEIGRTNTPIYEKPSVLIGRKGTIDAPRFMATPFWTVDTLFYSEISAGADPKFLYYKFCLIDWYSFNEASGVPSLNAKTIEGVRQGMPKTKAEQKAIAETLSDIDAEIAALEKRRDKTRAIKQGMMQELLTGRTRLVGSAL